MSKQVWTRGTRATSAKGRPCFRVKLYPDVVTKTEIVVGKAYCVARMTLAAGNEAAVKGAIAFSDVPAEAKALVAERTKTKGKVGQPATMGMAHGG